MGDSKEAKKSKQFKESVEMALEALRNPVPTPLPSSEHSKPSSDGAVDPLVIFTPLRLACETKSLPLMISALDCIGKLVSYDFFQDSPDFTPPPQDDIPEDGAGDSLPVPGGGGPVSIADLITSTVCDCFSPSPVSASSSSASASHNAATTQHDTLLLKLLSSLLSLILSNSLSVHQSSLLKAVRTVYNVFLMGRIGTVQTVAQATLGQIVGGVFSRIDVSELGAQARALHAQVKGAPTTIVISEPLSRNGHGSRVDLSIVEEEGAKEESQEDGPSKEVNAEAKVEEPAVGTAVSEAEMDTTKEGPSLVSSRFS